MEGNTFNGDQTNASIIIKVTNRTLDDVGIYNIMLIELFKIDRYHSS